jgi:co-chaperonin GroES (HSP10)
MKRRGIWTPLGDRIMVKLDPLKEVSKGGIALISDNTVSPVRTGLVLRVGPGSWVGSRRQPIGVEPGERVAFLRWHLEHQSGKQIMHALSQLEDDVGLLKDEDILFAFPSEQSIEVTL